MRLEVDVLTLSATPIPRTMHMALSGIRDTSIIQTAPEPITTAAKGTKKYKILPLDSKNTYIVEERWLKYSNKK